MSTRNLTLLQINDLHGYLAPHPELFELGLEAHCRSGGGLERIATIFRDVRREVNGAVIALDSGDTFHGTMAAVHTRGQALIAPMRALELDAMTAHWDFAYGYQRLREIDNELPYPILGANCKDQQGGAALQPLSLIERAGIRVGVVGLAAVVAGRLLPPGEPTRLELTIGDAELRSCIRQLRHELDADVVVVLSHLGFPQDCKLAAAVPGIDVLLSGHTHNRLETPTVINDTVIMQSGAHGSFVGRLDLKVFSDGVAEWTHALLPVDDRVEPDSRMKALTEEALRPFMAARRDVVAETGLLLHRYAMLESTMDSLLLDAVAAAAGTSVAVSNGWRYGVPIPPGPVTEFDLWNIVPADPPVSVVQLTGRQIRQLLEDNLEATFACDPWKQRGGYLKRCRGIEMAFKVENPAGCRIQELRISGARVADDARISVGFLGDQAIPPGLGSDRRSTGMSAVQALRQYLRTQRLVAPVLQGHIRMI